MGVRKSPCVIFVLAVVCELVYMVVGDSQYRPTHNQRIRYIIKLYNRPESSKQLWGLFDKVIIFNVLFSRLFHRGLDFVIQPLKLEIWFYNIKDMYERGG